MSFGSCAFDDFMLPSIVRDICVKQYPAIEGNFWAIRRAAGGFSGAACRIAQMGEEKEISLSQKYKISLYGGMEMTMTELIGHVLMHAVTDTLRLVPFLFLTYLVMEYLEHKTQKTTRAMIQKAGRLGPLIGGAAGAFPQCGFSAAASSFYAGGVISVGTLMAVFLSTSDEMLPIFISEAVDLSVILKILGVKILIGAVSGAVLDILWKAGGRKRREYHEHKHIHREHHEKDIHDLCEHEHCHCEEGSILKSAVIHSLQITLFIFLVTLAIGFLVEVLGEDQIGAVIGSQPVLGVFLAGLVGMIPNCAGSVIITQMYLGGLLGTGQMLAGLLAGAGVGILVLCRTNRGAKENLGIIGLLYGISVCWGILFEILGVTF